MASDRSLRGMARAARDRIFHTSTMLDRLSTIEHAVALDKSRIGASEVDDSIEHTTYLADRKRFPREYAASPHVFCSTACRSDYFHLPLYNYWCERIRQSPVFHRKQWEFVY